MKTQYKFIYFIENRNYYLVRFRKQGKYVQAVFGNRKNNNEALNRALEWRNKNIPIDKGLYERPLFKKPFKNKTSKLPAGIIFTYNIKKTKNKILKYPSLAVTAGFDGNGKLIQKRINIKKYLTLKAAILAAVNLRKQLASKHNKKFLQL
jgi:hypothetical protein